MTWHKKVKARFKVSLAVNVDAANDIRVDVDYDPPIPEAELIFFYLTQNQAGDLAHALQEAIQKATEAKR